MKTYALIFFNTLSIQMSYKFNFVSSLINNLLSVLVSVFTWTAIYASSSQATIGQLNKDQMMAYLVLANLTTLIFSTSLVLKMGGLVRSGKLTAHLLRPYSLVLTFLAEFLAEKVPFIGLYLLVMVWGLVQAPHSLAYTGMLLVFFLSNLAMFFMMMMAISNLGFRLLHMWPLRPILTAIYTFFGGLLFPLTILPEGLYQVMVWNPFSLVAHRYILALQHGLSLKDLCLSIVASNLWGIAFYGLYQLGFKKGLEAYESVGG